MAKPDWTFSWTDLLPEWIVKLATGTSIKPGESFEWRDLLPGFITKIWDAGEAADWK